MKLSFFAAGAVVAGLVVWAVLSVWKATDVTLPEDAPREHAKKIAEKKPARKARPAAKRADKAEGKVAQRRVVEDDGLTEAEQKVMDDIQSALDDENFASVSKLAADAASSTNAAIRLRAVEALNWFGKESLAPLTMFMADADEDVRESACDAWRTGVSQIEDPALRGDIALAGMKVVRSRDQLDFMVMEIDDLSNSQQIRILQDLIQGDNPTAASVAREHYEFVTGDAYESPEAAQKWLDENPDDE